MKLSVPEFLEIRARRSQDDMKTLIAYVEDKLGVKPAQPEPPLAQTDVPRGAFVQPDEPQTVVTVADPTPAPQRPIDDNPPTDVPESENVLKRKQSAADRRKTATRKSTAKKATAKKSSSKRSSSKAKDARTTSGPARQDLAIGTFRDTPPATGTKGVETRVTQRRDSAKP